jgi:hypothetical protein
MGLQNIATSWRISGDVYDVTDFFLKLVEYDANTFCSISIMIMSCAHANL